MNVRLFTKSDRVKWDDYVIKHSNSYHAHLIGWKEVFEKTYNLRSFYYLAEESNKICGILPIFLIKSILFGKQFISLPYLTYGGILANTKEIGELLIMNAMRKAHELKVDLIEIRTTEKFSANLVKDDNIQINDSKMSMRLELSATSDDLFKVLNSKLRSQIKRPQKAGMVFKIGKYELIDDFYKVFSANMRDLGSPVHSKELFENIFIYLGNSVNIGIVYFRNMPVAVGLISLFKDLIEIPWASSIRKFNRFSSNMLLYWSFLEYGCKRQYQYFDFGRTSLGEGTHKFKKQWGAKPMILYWYKFNIKAKEIYTQPSDSTIMKVTSLIWKRMPLYLTNYFGPRIRKLISL
jgi:serine/alanine adding enzyme